MIKEIRCPNCGKKLAETEGKLIIKCPRCKSIVYADTKENKIEVMNTK